MEKPRKRSFSLHNISLSFYCLTGSSIRRSGVTARQSVNEVYFMLYMLSSRVKRKSSSLWLFYILFDFVLFASSLSQARKTFLLSTVQRTFFYVACVTFLMLRQKGEWIWVYALLNLLKHRLRRWQRPKEESKKKQRRKKLQNIAQSDLKHPGERNMLIFSVIRMFRGIMLVIFCP